ncbi:MAG: hypothetical protein JWO53_172, partial [Chlamydiia bacterium]|nr:hypothetical protein [Chlamydiia bacterium]
LLTSSKMGAKRLHGVHHVAYISTITNREELTISSKVSLLSSITDVGCVSS